MLWADDISPTPAQNLNKKLVLGRKGVGRLFYFKYPSTFLDFVFYYYFNLPIGVHYVDLLCKKTTCFSIYIDIDDSLAIHDYNDNVQDAMTSLEPT